MIIDHHLLFICLNRPELVVVVISSTGDADDEQHPLEDSGEFGLPLAASPRRRHVDFGRRSAARCGGASVVKPELRTCRRCKNQFDPLLNHSAACRFHPAHFGGETKRKFESVHTGGTMSTAESGKILHYWHCCGSENPSDQGCTLGPHSSYDDE